MNYLFGYLAIGVVVLLAAIVESRLDGSTYLDHDSAEMRAANPNRSPLRMRIMVGMVVPILAGAAMIALWPAIPVMQGKEFLEKKMAARAKKFRVRRRDRLQELTVQEIEARERVTDPLGAVPDLPFGHLNAAWCRFTAQMKPTDSLWSFSAQWTTPYREREQRTGYVAWRFGSAKRYFLTGRKMEAFVSQ